MLLVLAAPLAVASGSERASAIQAPFVFQTELSGSQNVPAVETVAWGFVRFFFNEDRTTAEYTVDVKGFSGNLVAGADIHRGAPGVNGPVVYHLADGGFIVTGGKLQLNGEELAEMEAGLWYISLKTTMHPQGELRGQIAVPAGFRTAPETSAAIPPTVRPQQPAPSGASQPPQPSTAIEGPVTILPPNTGDAGLRR